MAREINAVLRIERQLAFSGRYYVNVHGSIFSQGGTPDIMTLDASGIMTGIEVKRHGQQPGINQWRRGLEIINSGGRFVIGYDDFDLVEFDADRLPKIHVKGRDEFDLYDAFLGLLDETRELVLDEDGV